MIKRTFKTNNTMLAHGNRGIQTWDSVVSRLMFILSLCITYKPTAVVVEVDFFVNTHTLMSSGQRQVELQSCLLRAPMSVVARCGVAIRDATTFFVYATRVHSAWRLPDRLARGLVCLGSSWIKKRHS